MAEKSANYFLTVTKKIRFRGLDAAMFVFGSQVFCQVVKSGEQLIHRFFGYRQKLWWKRPKTKFYTPFFSDEKQNSEKFRYHSQFSTAPNKRNVTASENSRNDLNGTENMIFGC